MKIQFKIGLYNFLTVTFAFLTMVSLGSIGQLPLLRVLFNVVAFTALTYFCVNRENHFRAVLRSRRRKAKKVQLSVYNGRQTAKVA